MEMREEEVVMVGTGIAGLTTSLGLHRLGLQSLVLESSYSLRITGFAPALWTNAWRALDAVALGDSLRQLSLQMQGFSVASVDSDLPTSESLLERNLKRGGHESHSVKRKDLLEMIHEALPQGTIRYSSKVVSIEKSGLFKFIHLADGSIIKTKSY